MPSNKSPHYLHLLDKWTEKHRSLQQEIFDKNKEAFEWLSDNSKQFALGSIAGAFLLTPILIPRIPINLATASTQFDNPIGKEMFAVGDLKNVLPSQVEPLTPQVEDNVSQILTRTYNIKVKPALEGKRLNATYGFIGQEQHLARYPGDSLYSHFDNPDEEERYSNYGMAPGLGGWGYFANSQENMTQEDSLREKYYIAVQTFLAPGFDENRKEYLDFFKYRKMLVVNPQNGKAIVTDIADAGPATWTGKQLGGSPEVMKYLERYDGAQRGPVLYFFVDDLENKIPLGPVEL